MGHPTIWQTPIGAIAGFAKLVEWFGLWPVGVLVFIILALNFCVGDYE